MVPFPLLTPQTLLWTRLPPVARLNARGPQGRLVLQEYTLDGSGAGRSDGVSVLHRMAAHCYARRITQGKFRALQRSKSETTHGTEPPRNPRLAANASLSGQRKVKGVSRGDIGNRRCPTSPFAPAVDTAFPVGGHRQSPRRGHGVSAARRRQCPACPSAATHRLRRQAAGTAEPLTLC